MAILATPKTWHQSKSQPQITSQVRLNPSAFRNQEHVFNVFKDEPLRPIEFAKLKAATFSPQVVTTNQLQNLVPHQDRIAKAT